MSKEDDCEFVLLVEGEKNPAIMCTQSKKVKARMNRDEIFFYEKGIIPYTSLRFVHLVRDQDKVKVSFDVNANEAWNEKQKTKHPIRWALGLIGKSKAFCRSIGYTRDKSSIEALTVFFRKKNINIDWNEEQHE